MRLPKGKGVLVIGSDRDSSRNYIGKVLALAKSANLAPGKVWHATVIHENDCPAINGGGYCGCDPDVRMGTPEEFHEEIKRGRGR